MKITTTTSNFGTHVSIELGSTECLPDAQQLINTWRLRYGDPASEENKKKFARIADALRTNGLQKFLPRGDIFGTPPVSHVTVISAGE